jgi:hypothetical protein
MWCFSREPEYTKASPLPKIEGVFLTWIYNAIMCYDKILKHKYERADRTRGTFLARRLLLICLLFFSVLFVTVAAYCFTQPPESSKPYWLTYGNYVTYEQAFKWNNDSKTEYMAWNVTGLKNDTTDIYPISHGVNVNADNISIVMGEANWTINTNSREVLASSTSDYIGQKWPFWIPTNVKVGSTVDIWYGANTVSTSESINVLGQQRNC